MKLNKILMALAASAIVGCTSDDLNDFTAKQAPEDSRLVELTPDFVIAGVGVDGNVTRTHWDKDGDNNLVNQFLPIYKATATFTSTLDKDADLEAQAVGLCWLGQTVGTDVYTNYQFYHFGWLNKGETEADIECNQLNNGALYSDIAMATGTVSAEAIPGTDWVPAGLPLKATEDGAGTIDILNYNSGVYKTDNKAIFGGQYIVYYPFNKDFNEQGTIPAEAKTLFTWDVATDTYKSPELGKATFRYSSPVIIEGGDQAAGFGMHNLSTLVRLRVSTVAGDANIGDAIDQVVLYSPSQKLLKQANLAADKIVAGQEGTALYAEKEGIKTITTNFITTDALLDVKAATTVSAYITVLPTTVNDLKVLVHNKTKKTWATVEMGNTEFKAGAAKALEITVASTDFSADYIAVDDASLRTALTEANAAVVADPTATPTITVIGDITLATNLDLTPDTYTESKSFTITGDAIIVPEDVLLRVNTNMEADIRVLGKSCCTGALGGRLSLYGGMISNVTMEPTEAKVTDATYEDYNPKAIYTKGSTAITVAAGKTFDVQAGTVEVRRPVQHKGNLNIAEGAKVTVDGLPGTGKKGDLNFMGSTVVNDGTIEVLAGGKFDMTDADGNATASDGQRMTNNGTFIHNVDAAVGTAVQSMHQNGEYRCRVNDQIKLDDAYQQWTACSVIEMVEPSPAAIVEYDLGAAKPNIAYKHNNKYIDIEVNSTSGAKFINKKDNETIQVGNLTVTAGGLEIDYKLVTGTPAVTYRRTLTVNGDMVVADDATITNSQKINITGDLTVEDGATLLYKGDKANVDGLAVTGDITVSAATFDADEVDAINITCANFYLEEGATAKFGNRKDGATKSMTVSGEISNPTGCTFSIHAANQVAGSVLARITCTKLTVGGSFPGGRPLVVAAE